MLDTFQACYASYLQRRYDIELQMFFYNPKYGCSFDEAVENGAGKGDAIVGFSILICQNGYKGNAAYTPIINGEHLLNLQLAISGH